MNLSVLLAMGRAAARADLHYIFEKEFAGVVIEEAGTIEEASRPFKASAHPGYTVVVIDARLPAHDGQRESFVFEPLDWMVRRMAFKQPGAPFDYVVLSANLIDPVIVAWRRRAVAEMKANPVAGSRRFIAKSGPDWVGQLREAAREVLHPRRIMAQFEEILPLFGAMADRFTAGPDLARAGSRDHLRAGYLKGRDPTHRLAVFMRDIEVHWRYLNEDMRAKIGDLFVVSPTPGQPQGVNISLL